MGIPEEIEEFYSNQIENIDKEYLESLKNTEVSAKKNLESSYKSKLGEVIKKYEEDFKKYLESQKQISKNQFKNKGTKKVDPDKEDKEILRGPFKLKKFEFGLGRKEKLDFKLNLLKFSYKIKVKKTFYRLVPLFAIKFYFKLKIFSFNLKRIFLNSFDNAISGTINDGRELYEKLKKFILNVYTLLRRLSLILHKRIKSLFTKKDDGKPQKKSEDEEIAERILKKNQASS